MNETKEKPQKKSILKTSENFDSKEVKNDIEKPVKWDEINILQTLHPPDKDYGHMKVDEPKTPFVYYDDDADLSDDDRVLLDPELLTEK